MGAEDGSWTRFKRKAFVGKSVEHLVNASKTTGELSRVLAAADVLWMGVGAIIGAGIFVITGAVAREQAGPGVMLSYVVASVAAMLAALCYSEFAADVPISGSAYNYVAIVFGEFPSWIAATALLMQYLVSICTIAKGFSGYFATLIGLPGDALVFSFSQVDFVVIDIGGAALVALIAVMLSVGIQDSFTFQRLATATAIVSILFTVGTAATRVDLDNLTPLVPSEYGLSGVLHGASLVFFSYLGFDSVAALAEEVRNPQRDIPIGICGSIAICALLYFFMAAAIVGIVPYQEIDVLAPYSVAFRTIGLGWAARIVSVGALAGVATSLFSMICTMARLVMVLGRDGFLPAFFSKVNLISQVPVHSTLFVGIVCAAMSLILDIVTLSSIVSIGTLFAFVMVCAACIWRRFCPIGVAAMLDHDAPRTHLWVGVRVIFLCISSIVEGFAVHKEWPLWIWLAAVGFFCCVTASFLLLPVVYKAEAFSLPFNPIIPCFGLLSTIHLLVTLEMESFIKFLLWEAVAVILYFSYGVYHTDEAVHFLTPLLAPTSSSISTEFP